MGQHRCESGDRGDPADDGAAALVAEGADSEDVHWYPPDGMRMEMAEATRS